MAELINGKWYPSLNWKERGLPKPGAKPKFARRVIANRFGLNPRKARKLNSELISWITKCKDNSAIRLLLGVSR